MSIWISASAGLETTSGNTVRSLAASGQHTCGHEGLSPPVLLVRPTCGRVPGNAAPAMCPLKSCSHLYSLLIESYYYTVLIICCLLWWQLAEYV
jgi:hypothetical protein